MGVRAKFTVQERTEYSHASGKVRLAAQYDPSLPEDQRFSKATPSGTLEMHVDNPAAFEQFKPGATFYLDFTPTE